MKGPNDNHPSGLLVCGMIQERTRRYVTVKGNKVEIVTYMISDDLDRHHYVEDFAPSDYYEIGECVAVSVYVKPYQKRNGNPSYTLCTQKEYHHTSGEAF
jgi:hypothetical protein